MQVLFQYILIDLAAISIALITVTWVLRRFPQTAGRPERRTRTLRRSKTRKVLLVLLGAGAGGCILWAAAHMPIGEWRPLPISPSEPVQILGVDRAAFKVLVRTADSNIFACKIASPDSHRCSLANLREEEILAMENQPLNPDCGFPHSPLPETREQLKVIDSQVFCVPDPDLSISSYVVLLENHSLWMYTPNIYGIGIVSRYPE